MPSPQNDYTHSNNSLATDDELFECVWSFCGVGAQRVKCTGKAMIMNTFLVK